MNSIISSNKHEATTVYTIKTGKWKQNSYIAINHETNKLIVIDPGGEEHNISKCIDSLKGDIDGIYLTHAHHDHVGALDFLCQKYNKKFFIHEADYKIFRRAPMFALTFEARKLVIPTNREIYYNDVIFTNVDSNGVRCISSPGHTPGGVIVYFDNVAFTGDTLLNKMIGRTDLPGASPQLLASSIDKFLAQLNNHFTLYPGHGGHWSVTEAREWWNNNSNQPPEYREE